MAALALDSDDKAVGGSVAVTVLQAVFTGAGAGGVMAAEHGIHLGIFQTAFVHHTLGAALIFFIGLEEQFHVAGQFLLMGADQLCRTQQRGGVQIVAAGMHNTGILGGKGQAGLFLHGQGIDIGAQTDGLAGLTAADDAQNAGIGTGLAFNAHGLQFTEDEGLGTGLTTAQLGVSVDVPADLDHIIGQSFGFLQDIFSS